MKKAQFPFVEFVRVATSLCMAFKGVLPSDLWLKYNQDGGKYLMELDMHIAIEINEKKVKFLIDIKSQIFLKM